MGLNHAQKQDLVKKFSTVNKPKVKTLVKPSSAESPTAAEAHAMAKGSPNPKAVSHPVAFYPEDFDRLNELSMFMLQHRLKPNISAICRVGLNYIPKTQEFIDSLKVDFERNGRGKSKKGRLG